jgi:hypothetical protein
MHLVANADDDGIVDAFTIMRMVGAKEDDLVLLKEREYITILDEHEWILWITNWQDFNRIPPHIKEDSKYLPLLKATVKGLEIVQSTKEQDNKRRYGQLKIQRQSQKNTVNDPNRILIGSLQDHDDDPNRIIAGSSQDHFRIIAGSLQDHGHDPNSRIDKDRKDKDKKNTPLTPQGEDVLNIWKKEMGTTLREKLADNVKSGLLLVDDGDLDKLSQFLREIRIARSLKYCPRMFIMATSNFIQIVKHREMIETYIQSQKDAIQANLPVIC